LETIRRLNKKKFEIVLADVKTFFEVNIRKNYNVKYTPSILECFCNPKKLNSLIVTYEKIKLK